MISLNCIFSSITRLEGAKVEIGNVLVSRHDGGAAVAAAAVGVAWRVVVLSALVGVWKQMDPAS